MSSKGSTGPDMILGEVAPPGSDAGHLQALQEKGARWGWGTHWAFISAVCGEWVGEAVGFGVAKRGEEAAVSKQTGWRRRPVSPWSCRPGEATQPRAAHWPRPQRLGPGPLSRSLHGIGSELRGEWLLFLRDSPAPGLLPWVGTPPPSGGAGSPVGAWRGRAPASVPGGLEEVSVARPLREGPLALRLPAPHTKAPTETPHLPARAGSRRRRAGGRAGGGSRARVRVSACVPVSVCASVYVCACV